MNYLISNIGNYHQELKDEGMKDQAGLKFSIATSTCYFRNHAL